jgi:hypothetical protein
MAQTASMTARIATSTAETGIAASGGQLMAERLRQEGILKTTLQQSLNFQYF